MKKVLIFIAAVALGLLPTMAFATSAAPWSITNLTDTFIFPNLVNGTPKGILVSASSTINGAFTIATSTSGCATFSPTGLIYSTGVGCGTGSGSSTFGTTSISATAPLNWNTTTATMSITQAGTGANGYLSSTDFNTFNNKIASTSLSGVGGTSYNSTTGVISSFSYPFPSNATTTALTLGGLTLSNLAGGGTLCVHVNNSGTLSTTASDCGSSGGTVTSVTATYPIISSGGTTPNISTAFGTTTGWGIGINGIVMTGSTGIPFNVPTSSPIALSITGNAGTATALATGRTISITGDLAYTSPSFDGSGNVTAAGTLATVNGNVGTFTYPSVTVNGKGLITAISNGTAPTTYTGTFPIVVTGSVISSLFSTTTNSGITAGNLYVGAGGIFQSTATGTVSNGTGISVTAGQSVIGSGLTITNTGVTSAVAGTGIAVSGATGAVTFTNTIGYPFTPVTGGSATTSVLFPFGLITASSTIGTLTATSSLTLPFISGTQCLHSVSGVVSGTGSDCGSGSGSAFPFTPALWGNATGTVIGFQGGLFSTGSSTFSGPLHLSTLNNGTVNVANTIVYSTPTSTITAGSGIAYTGTMGGEIGGVSGTLSVSGLTGSNFSNASANTVFGNPTGVSAAPQFFATSTLFTGTTGQAAWFSAAGLLTGTSSLLFTSATSTFASDVLIQKTSPSAFAIADGFGTLGLLFNNASTTGSIFTVAATTTTNAQLFAGTLIKLFDVDQYGHLMASSTGATVTVSSCGTAPAVTSNSTDSVGSVTTGTGSPTACTITFAHPFAFSPAVLLTDTSNAVTIDISAVSTSAFTISMSAALNSTKIYWMVIQGPGNL